MVVKPGWTTSEWWMTVLTNVLAAVVAVATVFGKVVIPGPYAALIPIGAMLAAAIATAYYAHSRAVVRAAALKAAGAVEAANAPVQMVTQQGVTTAVTRKK